MNAKSINSNYQYLVSGGILLGAVLYDRLKQRLVRGE
jgi:ribose/xylose/arabinose/galactoside ABC-type transport system permease subunit